MRRNLSPGMLGVMTVVAAGFVAPSSGVAQPYPIDCAILLCMAGGFPPSAECTAAQIEVIRRVTPWPIEPPLQLWNCPMGGGGSMPGPNLGSDGLTPQVRRYRDAVEVWELSKRIENSSGGRNVSATAIRNFYNSDGEFVRQAQSNVPAWVSAAVAEHTGSTFTSDHVSFRAILLRMQDHTGAYSTQWVSY
ncbi:hypothetical protein [Paracoccus liaowanqingii]|uniref:hypothetical protein n=1 Tax=Paracoccus liaowanqingii TaxID=2560053 RepID=UPI0038B31812